jgi:receptor expression-enhancing protein 1/2/3/4
MISLVLGTLYPAYRSYKAIKNKDVREHVKWMMYWIVFALFTTLETFLDIFFSWFPFYYEIKILFILWVLSPATRGSSLLYKKVVHPMLQAREKEIDELIEKTKQQGYTTFLNLFSAGFDYASTLFVTSAMKGQSLLGSQLKKSLSMNDVGNEPPQQKPRRTAATIDEHDDNDDNDDDSSDLYEEEAEKVRRHGPTSSYTNLNGHVATNNAAAVTNGRKPSLNTREYEFIDDNMWMPDELDMRGKHASGLPAGPTRRKASGLSSSSAATSITGVSATSSSRPANFQATTSNSNQKSNEVIKL